MAKTNHNKMYKNIVLGLIGCAYADTLVWEDDLTVAIRLVTNKIALKDCTVAKEQLTEALSRVHDPVALIIIFANVAAPVGDLSVAILLAA